MLAMLQIFFGQSIREKFDFEVGRKFVHVANWWRTSIVDQTKTTARYND